MYFFGILVLCIPLALYFCSNLLIAPTRTPAAPRIVTLCSRSAGSHLGSLFTGRGTSYLLLCLIAAVFVHARVTLSASQAAWLYLQTASWTSSPTPTLPQLLHQKLSLSQCFRFDESSIFINMNLRCFFFSLLHPDYAQFKCIAILNTCKYVTLAPCSTARLLVSRLALGREPPSSLRRHRAKGHCRLFSKGIFRFAVVHSAAAK